MDPPVGAESLPSSRHLSPRGGPARCIEVGVLVVALAAAVGLAVIWTRVGVSVPEPQARDFDVMRPAVATPAPDFTLPDLAGHSVGLGGVHGRVVLLNFWATWCAPCVRELPAIERVERDFRNRGLVVLAVNYKEPPEVVGAFTRKHGLGVRVLLDRDGEVAQRYRVAGLPTTVLVDRTRLIAGSVVGYRDWDGLAAQAYLRQLASAGVNW